MSRLINQQHLFLRRRDDDHINSMTDYDELLDRVNIMTTKMEEIIKMLSRLEARVDSIECLEKNDDSFFKSRMYELSIDDHEGSTKRLNRLDEYGEF